jgi:hypothetical protein
MRWSNDERLQDLLSEHAEVIDATPERWRVRFEGRELLVSIDEATEHLRIMVPVTADVYLDELDLQMVLTANFDRTLDARYAMAGGYLWAVYLHPLAELSGHLLAEGLRQVKELAESYGQTYSCGELVFSEGRP